MNTTLRVGERSIAIPPTCTIQPVGRWIGPDVQPLAERHLDLVRVPGALEDHPADVGRLHHSRNRVSV